MTTRSILSKTKAGRDKINKYIREVYNSKVKAPRSIHK